MTVANVLDPKKRQADNAPLRNAHARRGGHQPDLSLDAGAVVQFTLYSDLYREVRRPPRAPGLMPRLTLHRLEIERQ